MDITIERGTIVKIDGQPRRLYADLVVEDVPEAFLDNQNIMEYCWLDKMDVGL